MAQFEQLQELWQAQPELPAAHLDDVKPLLRAYGRRQSWINAGKAILAGSILTACFLQARSSPLRMSGVVLIAIAAALLLIRDWRSQRAIGRSDFAAPSAGFVNATIERLLEQRNVRRSYYWTLLGATVIGENLILSGAHRLWPRLVASLAPFAAVEAGLWVRRRRFDYECAPLLEQLRAAKAALEDRSV
jgi:hypothetical protein